MVLQIMGIIFTLFGMYKSMVVYTSMMWSATVVIFIGSCIAELQTFPKRFNHYSLAFFVILEKCFELCF